MAKFIDKFKTDVKATTCRRKRGEPAQQRHDRRKSTALREQNDAQRWAEYRGIRFRVSNDGHHFMFTRGNDPVGKHFAQWWPQTAKLVFWHRYDFGVHAHDMGQVIVEMERVLAGQARKPHRKPKGWA